MQGNYPCIDLKESKSSMSSAFNLTLVQYFFPSGVVTLISMIVPSTNASCDTARKNIGNYGWLARKRSIPDFIFCIMVI